MIAPAESPPITPAATAPPRASAGAGEAIAATATVAAVASTDRVLVILVTALPPGTMSTEIKRATPRRRSRESETEWAGSTQLGWNSVADSRRLNVRRRALRSWRFRAAAAASSVADQRLAERPDGARHAVTAGDHLVERAHDPIAILVVDHQGRQQLDRVAGMSRHLTEDLVFFEQRDGDELTEQTLVGG